MIREGHRRLRSKPAALRRYTPVSVIDHHANRRPPSIGSKARSSAWSDTWSFARRSGWDSFHIGKDDWRGRRGGGLRPS